MPKGGLYDRYRMDTDLDVVAADPRVSSVDFFRGLPKSRVDSPIGSTLTPNFYYRISTARLTLPAPSRAIRRRLPGELAPLEVAQTVAHQRLQGFTPPSWIRHDRWARLLTVALTVLKRVGSR